MKVSEAPGELHLKGAGNEAKSPPSVPEEALLRGSTGAQRWRKRVVVSVFTLAMLGSFSAGLFAGYSVI